DTDAHWIATVVLSEPIPGLIHRDDDAVPTQGHHFPVERPEDGAAQRNAVDEGLVRRFHLGDVDGAADVTLEAAVSANARDSVIEYRAVETVAPSQAILEGERLPRGQRLEVAAHAFLPVVGVDTLEPAVPLFLLERPSGELEPRAVEVDAAPI